MDNSWRASVILITSNDPKNKDFGTGFPIYWYEPEDVTYIVTCAHVVEAVGGPDKIVVIPAQVGGVGYNLDKMMATGVPEKLPATQIASGEEEYIDIAILQVEGLRDKRPLHLRHPVDEEGKFFKTAGFSQRTTTDSYDFRVLELFFDKRSQTGRVKYVDYWDLEINEKNDHLQSGYSGSPVVDENGYVVAVVNAQEGSGKRGYSISIEALEVVCPGMFSHLFEQNFEEDEQQISRFEQETDPPLEQNFEEDRQQISHFEQETDPPPAAYSWVPVRPVQVQEQPEYNVQEDMAGELILDTPYAVSTLFQKRAGEIIKDLLANVNWWWFPLGVLDSWAIATWFANWSGSRVIFFFSFLLSLILFTLMIAVRKVPDYFMPMLMIFGIVWIFISLSIGSWVAHFFPILNNRMLYNVILSKPISIGWGVLVVIPVAFVVWSVAMVIHFFVGMGSFS